MKKLTIITAMAFAAMSFASITASAQVTPAAGNNDLILGFQATTSGSQGFNTNLEVDLGPASSFTAAASFNNLGLLGADLVSTYGANWASRTDILWSVAGVVGSNVYDITSNTPPTERSTYGNYIGGLITTINSSNATAAAGVGAATVGTTANPASGITGSYTSALVGAGTGDFGITSLAIGQSQSAGPVGSLELYKFVRAGGTSTPATDLGTFVLSGSGSNANFAFNPAAAPEPSAYALGLCAVVLFFVLKRRSSIA